MNKGKKGNMEKEGRFKLNYNILVIAILIIHFILAYSSAWNLSVPVDFAQNMGAGYKYFKEGWVSPTSTTSQGHIFGIAPIILGLGPFSDEVGFTKLKAGNGKGLLALYGALDRNELNQEFYSGIEGVDDSNLKKILRLSYFIESLLSVITAWIIYLWAKEAFGKNSGLFAMSFYAFSPFMTSITHSLHSDNSVRLFTVLTFYLFWKFIMNPSKKMLIFASISMGAMLSAKVSTAYYPAIIMALLLFAFYARDEFKSGISQFFKTKNQKPMRNLILICIVIFAVTLLTVNSLYLFKGVFTKLSDYSEGEPRFQSAIFKTLQGSFTGDLPLPVSPYYLLGVDYGKAWTEGSQGTYLYYMGNIYTGDAPKSYYPVSLITKATLPVLALFLLLHIFLILSFMSSDMIWSKMNISLIYLLFAAYSIFLFTAITTKLVSGPRHLSMIFPLIFISISWLANLKNMKLKLLFYSLLALHIITYLFAYPFFIPYFNQFVGNDGYLYFRESEISYHEEYYRAIEYKNKNPSVALFPNCFVENGIVSMSPNDLNFQRAGCYGWLKNFEPTDYIAGSWPVYKVEGKWVQNEGGQANFIPSPSMKLRKSGINPVLQWIADS